MGGANLLAAPVKFIAAATFFRERFSWQAMSRFFCFSLFSIMSTFLSHWLLRLNEMAEGVLFPLVLWNFWLFARVPAALLSVEFRPRYPADPASPCFCLESTSGLPSHLRCIESSPSRSQGARNKLFFISFLICFSSIREVCSMALLAEPK